MSNAAVQKMREDYAIGPREQLPVIGARYGVSHEAVRNALLGRSYVEVGGPIVDEIGDWKTPTNVEKEIIALRIAGWSYIRIAEKLDRSEAGVMLIYKRLVRDGKAPSPEDLRLRRGTR